MTGGIEVRSASKRYDGHGVLDRVDLAVPAGTVLVGPSGCGKSTLLRLVNGLVVPDSGDITSFGQRLTPAELPRLRLRMGYVIQEGGLFPHLSALRNVTLMAEELDWTPDNIRQRVEYLRALVRLPADLLERAPAQLSGGQRQRVSIMRALMLEPKILLLDEPLGALDPVVRAELQDDLKHVFEEVGATVLLVTHDMAEAVHFASQVAVLRAGRILWHGSPESLLAERAEPFVQKLLASHRDLRREARP